MKKLAVIGAGTMARMRTKALLGTGKVSVCGVAARTIDSARKFGAELGCEQCVDDFRSLSRLSPDAVLVEVPHGAQDEIVLWALEQKLHTLIGGCLATTTAAAERIARTASASRVLAEAGHEARYDAVWVAAKELVDGGALGRIVTVRSIALWAGDPNTWYYQQQASGGMPLTHMTYCFINPIRWMFGDPLCVSAFANRMAQTAPGLVREETCIANFLFPRDILCSMTASFVKPGDVPGWSVLVLGAEGAVELWPEEHRLTVYRKGHTEPKDFSSARDPFSVQAEAFVESLDGPSRCLNSPAATIGDIRAAEAVVTSARDKKAVWM